MTGVSKRTIDHYSNLNLLKPSRTESGYRQFEISDVEELKKIIHLKEQGYSLDEIKIRMVQDVPSDLVFEKALVVKNDLQELLKLLKEADHESSSIKESITHDTLPVIQAILQLLI